VFQTWFGANSAHAAQILPFQLFRHHHHVLRWDWHFRSTLCTIRQGFTSKSTLIPGTHPVSQTWFRGQFGTCSSNSTVPLLFRHHHHVLRWIGTSDPPSGTIRQGFTSKLPHLPQGRNQCCRRGWGQSGTCSSNSTVPIPPPPPCAAVGLALQIHPLVP
jgi:hypothetical protein